ncbi:uncharacterized protein LOC26526837 [Drosophila erecta]|uniref:uncharacterized protein LOC26526837 n=1 Tax=Drosophila erecta TaxID=7220 RepID=UPI0007326E06|nr:uncharacterized protein LOC26526837 [Drosophila erecta]KQS38819.1 uncharacterized protein Dere_GG27013 [Drosophila erecta]
MADIQIHLFYFICGPVFIWMVFMYFYYCYLNVRECRRSRGREATPSLLDDICVEPLEVY